MVKNVLSLFDGISCGQLALSELGISYGQYFASEVDEKAIEHTQRHFPNTIQLGDVTKIDVEQLPTIDLLFGGSPCQGFSFAGKQLNFDDDRSKLFFEFVRILKEVKPKYFMLENVNMKKEWQDVISELLGVQPLKINSSLISPCRRNRLYWTNIPNVTVPDESDVSFDDINQHSQDWLSEEVIERISNWKAQQKPLKCATEIGTNGKLPCLTARGYNQYHSGMILITDGTRYRYLTNNEAELAMGMPRNYTLGMTDRERSHAIGNAWDVNVIKHIFKNLK